jgi:hypothetical protein
MVKRVNCTRPGCLRLTRNSIGAPFREIFGAATASDEKFGVGVGETVGVEVTVEVGLDVGVKVGVFCPSLKDEERKRVVAICPLGKFTAEQGAYLYITFCPTTYTFPLAGSTEIPKSSDGTWQFTSTCPEEFMIT